MLTAGTLLHERFRVVRLMELGGMGAMYRAWDVQRGVPVSVKELTPQPDLSPDALDALRQQLEREVRRLMRLRHPAMVSLIDYFHGEDDAESAETGNSYLVMDFIEGESLSAYVARTGAVSERQVLTWADMLIDALAFCHENNVLHRDIKPQNVILTAEKQAVLVGFELAKLWDPNDPRSWTATRVMGSPEYAPPERWGLQTWHIDALSDIYSMGATLYYALTGQAPLTAGERTANPYQFLPVKALGSRVSAKTRAAVVKAMELPRGKRFQDALAMKAALTGDATVQVSEQVQPAALMISARSERTRRWALLIAVGVGVLLLAGLLGLAGRTLLGDTIGVLPSPEATSPLPEATQALPTLAPTVVVAATGTVTPSTTLPGVSQPVTTPIPPLEVPTGWSPQMSDAFDDNGNDWVVGAYADGWGTVSRVVDAGRYTWEISANQSVSRWCMPEIAPATDFYLTVDAQRASGPVDASYGLVFRHNEGSYYLFSVRDDGYYSFNAWYGFAWEPVVDWTGTFAIRAGEVNRLAVRAEGTQFTFYVNDEPVAEVDNALLAAGEAGLSILLPTPGDAVFVFDNFELSVP